MRTRATAATLPLTVSLLLTGCGTSYEESVQQCTQALKDRPEGEKGKPEACEPLTDDDYDALFFNEVIDDLGWTDENGDFDKNKMLEGTLEEQP
jgi:hypothetical protein